MTDRRLEADDSPETHSQFGLRAGVEAFEKEVSGSLSVEFGRRFYEFTEEGGATDLLTDSLALTEDDFIFSYSDFTYWEIWLMGAWTINDHFSLDLLANYQPERHTEAADDSALGFGSIRLVWKP